MSPPPSLLARLRDELGPGGVLTDPDDVAAYCSDWRGAHRGGAAGVLRPSSTAEVATAVRLCHDAEVGVVPQGGNTGLSGGAVPDASGEQVVLSLGRMRGIREVDPDADTVTVEAGVVLADLQQAAADVGRLFPLSLGAEGSCTVGGNLATNAGGTAVLRYGMMRDLTLGLEVVLPDGRVWDGLRALRKDNTGYDLAQLFVGSEGTLGVITAAVLRLFPATPRRATAWVALPTVDAGVSLLPALRRLAGGSLTAYELVSRQALDLVLTHQPGARDPFREAHAWYGLVELAGPDSADLDAPLVAALGEGFDRRLLADAVVAGSAAQRAGLWVLREGIAEAQDPEGPSLKHDVSVPISALAELMANTARALDAVVPGVRLVTYGHVGDGNLHHNLSKPRGMSDADFLARAEELSTVVHDHVTGLGGSISAEHGLGVAKRDAADRYLDPVELELMRTVKRAIDPRGVMNPGKLVSGVTPAPP